MSIRFSPVLGALLLALLPPAALAGPIVFQASGSDASAIQATVDNFRFALGLNNGNNSGPLASGRREINWDGGGATTTAAVGPSFAGFKNTRGALFTTPGSGFEQAILDDIIDNPTYATTFSTFSPSRVFTPVGSNVTDVTFFIPGSPAAAVVTAFGAVFSDVDTVAVRGSSSSGLVAENRTVVHHRSSLRSCLALERFPRLQKRWPFVPGRAVRCGRVDHEGAHHDWQL